MTEYIPWTAEQLDRNISELAEELKKLQRMRRLLLDRKYYYEKRRHDPDFVEATRIAAKNQKPRDRTKYMSEYGSQPEVKARNNKRRKRPEVKEKIDAYMAEYRTRPIFRLKKRLREAGLDKAAIAAEVEWFLAQSPESVENACGQGI